MSIIYIQQDNCITQFQLWIFTSELQVLTHSSIIFNDL